MLRKGPFTLNILVSRIDSHFSSLQHMVDDEDINSCVNFPCFSNNTSKWHAFLFHHGIVLLPMTIWRRLAHNIRHLVPIYKWSGEGRRKERHYGICALLFWHQSLLILIHKWQHVSLCPFCSDGLDSNDVSLVITTSKDVSSLFTGGLKSISRRLFIYPNTCCRLLRFLVFLLCRV